MVVRAHGQVMAQGQHYFYYGAAAVAPSEEQSG